MFHYFAGRDKSYSKEEAISQVKQAVMSHPKDFPVYNTVEYYVMLAYSQSKMTIDNEMAKYQRYK